VRREAKDIHAVLPFPNSLGPEGGRGGVAMRSGSVTPT
jgi:hypothetical protein